MCKRIDSGSPWPISNIPRSLVSNATSGQTAVARRDSKLWHVVRTSIAPPTIFQPEQIGIVSYLQSYWLATLRDYRLAWATANENLLIVSIGTGRSPSLLGNPIRDPLLQDLAASQSLMADCCVLAETLMQGMGDCLSRPHRTDTEWQSLLPHALVAISCSSHVCYDAEICHDLLLTNGENDNLSL